jgi:hypothetical protein
VGGLAACPSYPLRLAVIIAHEGRHIADAAIWVLAGEPAGGPLDLNHYFRELRGWYVSSYIAQVYNIKFAPLGGDDYKYQVWYPGWINNPSSIELNRWRGVSNILREVHHFTPFDEDTYSTEHAH